MQFLAFEIFPSTATTAEIHYMTTLKWRENHQLLTAGRLLFIDLQL